MAKDVGAVHDVSDGGLSGSAANPVVPDTLVGPATSAERNVITAGLLPVGCWTIENVRFDFDSSFVLGSVATEIMQLAQLRDMHKKRVVPRTNPQQPEFIFPPLAIFGHADPVGKDDYNKFLSGRRAAAIYGLLTRRDEIWEDLYKNRGEFAASTQGDQWGIRSIQRMLNELGFTPGQIDGTTGPKTAGAVKAFQSSQGLVPDGDPGPKTRKQLFLAYMDKICGADFRLDKENDFLARGKDASGKGDFQGCGEFNPLLIFSQKENTEFERAADKTDRNTANELNRRVMVLLFRPGSRVLSSKWPCPRAKEGIAGCVQRFWSNGEQRRSTRLPDTRRKFKDTQDTFACRFYQRLTDSSPCERLERGLAVFRITHELDGKPVANTLFEVRFPNGITQQVSSDPEGVIRLLGVDGQEFSLVAIADPNVVGTLRSAPAPVGESDAGSS